MPLPMYEKNPEVKIKNIIAIAAGKGGVGKSTATVNLGLALKQLGYTVGIMDTDVYGPSLRKMLPEEQLPLQKGKKIQPASSHGISTISMAYFRREDEAAAVRAPIANGIIQQFITDIEWGNLDFLLIDFPPGTGDIQLTLSQKAHLTGALMITTPQEVAVIDVKKAMNLFDQVRLPILGIIENMSYYLDEKTQERIYIFGKEGGKKLARDAGIPFFGEIPLDPYLSDCGDKGKSIFSQEKICKTSQGFLDIAHHLIHHTELLNKNACQSLQDFELIWKEM